ncbi:PERQ amino acid-rich with GYF domain-containing protein 2 [Armadillidium vulgare]|nr:PERQ amino acid-rich with GYF domain-containing protein 2 [Armadillidium vulgare]
MERLEDKLQQREEDNLEHMQSVADDLVAKLVDDEPRPLSDGRVRIHQAPPGGFLPPEPVSHPPHEELWYYTDPQGDIQGPFSSADMSAWCKAGYFKPSLLLRRECDDKFAQLGDLIKVFGRLPFTPGPPVPPLKQMMTMPPIVPPTMSTSLHTTTTAAAATVSHHQTGVNQELRSSLPSSITPPLAQQPPDPIQAFVAQMTTTSGSNHSISSETPLSQPPQSSSPIGGESPLQKLLLQLQRGSQSGVGGGLTTGGAGPLLPGHIPPSTLGTIPPSSSIGLEKNTPDQYDAIQSLMSQLTKMQMQGPENLQQEDPRLREEEQKRIEDERRLFEEQKRAEEERIKLQQLRLQEERLKEEERRKELEAKNQRLEEELRRIQEEQLKRKREEEQLRRKKEEEEQRRRKEEEQRAREAAEHKRKLEQQQKNAEASKKEEEQRRQQQQLKQKQKQEEEARKREEAKKAEEEERKRKEEQRLKEEQQRIREEKKKEEEEKKSWLRKKKRNSKMKNSKRRSKDNRRKQQQQHKKQKSSQPAWNTTSAAQDKNVAAPSLAEIQKAQEIKERKEREAEALREAQRQKEAQRQAAEEKKKQEANLKWAARVSQNNNNKGGSKATVNQPPEVPVKSLIEIQKEEEKLMKKRKEREQAERASLNHLTLNSAGVWSSASQSLSWANKAASAAAPVITLSNTQPGPQQAWNSSSNSLAWSAIAQSNVNNTSSGWNSETTMYNQNSSTQNLGGFWESPDAVKYGSVPTFVGFLADVESPYEVHDYIRSYLGDSKEVKEFAKQYLERRSKARNAQKEKHDEDNILAPAPAINPVSNLEFQEVKTRLRKGRKKMQKVDSSILGFSLNALERIDVEDAN